jgi:TetR/AcrR family transcriptional regulator, acrAB operon repressor
MRRTKAEAARTRAAIVDAALECFDRHGIAGSTLDQIAAEANVTKGAIYHHFEGKREILREIRDQVSLPMLDEADTGVLQSGDVPPLDRIERFLIGLVDTFEKDMRMRRALTIMQFRCEYVDGLGEILEGASRNSKHLTAAFRGAYEEAKQRGELAKHLTPETAALETILLMSGVIRLWLLHGQGSALRKNAREVIRAHIRSRRK